MNLPGGSVHGDKEHRQAGPPRSAPRPGPGGATGSTDWTVEGRAQRREPFASMIALHTDDMWQSVRCYPNVPGNRPSRQGAGPSAEGPFLRRGALPHCRGLPDTLAIPRPLSLQRGIPRQLVLVKNYRRIFARPSRENMAVSFRKIRKKIGILYKILRPARCGQALGNGRLFPAWLSWRGNTPPGTWRALPEPLHLLRQATSLQKHQLGYACPQLYHPCRSQGTRFKDCLPCPPWAARRWCGTPPPAG